MSLLGRTVDGMGRLDPTRGGAEGAAEKKCAYYQKRENRHVSGHRWRGKGPCRRRFARNRPLWGGLGLHVRCLWTGPRRSGDNVSRSWRKCAPKTDFLTYLGRLDRGGKGQLAMVTVGRNGGVVAPPPLHPGDGWGWTRGRKEARSRLWWCGGKRLYHDGRFQSDVCVIGR